VKYEHVKDAAQDIALDVAQDLAEDVSGAAEDRSVKVLITPPEATNTGPGFNRGSVGGAQGCGFEERAGAHARTEGVISYSPRPLCVSPNSAVCFFLKFPPKNGRARLSSAPYLSAARQGAPGRKRLAPWSIPSAACETHANGFFIVAAVATSALWTFEALCWCGRPSGRGGRHVKGGHVKDAANAAFRRQKG